MNKVQKNAIREADNYLKYAGRPSPQRAQAAQAKEETK